MLIQNTIGAPQAAHTSRHTSDGAPVVAFPRQTSVGQASSVPTSASSSATGQAQQASPAQLKDAVDTVNQAMRKAGQALEFSVDPDTNKPVIRMVDKDTGDLIRQIPSEEILAISRSIDQFLQRQGMLLSQKA